MSENILTAAENYSAELDRVFTAKSATAFFADNALRTKFLGAKTVMIPNVTFDGLANYDRKSGFLSGAVNVGHSTYTMTMDRARSFSIDREDMDESGVASLAGKILGEYVRTKVVPECDAYVISKLTETAENRGNILEGASLYEVFSNFSEIIGNVQGEVGYDEEIVCFVDSIAYAALCASEEFSRMLTVSDFKQGEITLRVKKINGVTIIPVVSERMRNAQEFSENGFSYPSNFKQVYMLALPKSAAHLVKKTEKMRVFTPEQNTTADAYKFDYRIYYDVFVKESAANAIWAWESSELIIAKQPSDSEGGPGMAVLLKVSVNYSGNGDIKYQWYECNGYDRSGSVKLGGYNIPEGYLDDNLEVGEHYYYCKITADGMAPIYSRVCKVTMK